MSGDPDINAPAAASRIDPGIALAICGTPQHGVTLLARQIAAAATDLGFAGHILTEPDPTRLDDLIDRLPGAVRVVHLHVNDWFFADSVTSAQDRIGSAARRLAERGIRLSVTLHDLPQLSDGPALFSRRATTYAEIVRAATGVAVSSEHERVLLREAVAAGSTPGPRRAGEPNSAAPAVQVIPLPIDPLPGVVPGVMPGWDHTAPVIGIFGYIYPGKGHQEILKELAGTVPGLTVLAIGRPSERHGDLLAELDGYARRGGITFRCTGFIPDSELVGRLRAPVIPVAPHTHISASGSINSWIAAGRRPLVPDGRYVRELERRLPGAVAVYEPGQLLSAVQDALTHPESTVLPKDFPLEPTTPEVAASYLTWLRTLAGPAGSP